MSSWEFLVCVTLMVVQVLCQDTSRLTIRMPKVRTRVADSYMCTNLAIPNHAVGGQPSSTLTKPGSSDWYITGFEPAANMSVAHHMLLFACTEPFSYRDSYDCGAPCSGSSEETIVYAWARQAPPLNLPSGVGFHVGGRTQLRYLVLQVHYLQATVTDDTTGLDVKITQTPQPREAGIFLLNGIYGNIPPMSQHVHIDVSCKFKDESIVPFAFRTHAHSLGRSIVAYHISLRRQDIREIGRGNPQWPQAFYPSATGLVIERNDFLLARCIYDSMDRQESTTIGSSHMDEMCNFYIMYHKPAGGRSRVISPNDCGGNNFPQLWQNVPKDSLDYSPASPPSVLAPSTPGGAPGDTGSELTLMTQWKVQEKIGQVGGLAVDKNNTLLVFHRGGRSWLPGTFDNDNFFRGPQISEKDEDADRVENPTPISSPVLLHIDPLTGKILDRHGAGLFYLPHGLFSDHRTGDVWITDVGAHQVMRFSKGNWDKPSLVLGEKLIPGKDEKHFCQPASVVVNAKGEIFVGDGYCNSRIVKFSPDGTYIKAWGSQSRSGDFQVVHSLALIESLGLVCAADRERASIECFTFDGAFHKRFHGERMFGVSIFAIVWHEKHKLLYGVTGPGYAETPEHPHIFGISLDTGKVTSRSWGDRHLWRPHDIAVSPDGACLYVGEIGPNRVQKFHVKGEVEAGTKSTTQTTANPSSLSRKLTSSLKHLTDGRASLIIGLFLVIPVLVLLSVLLIVRLSRAGSFPCFPRIGRGGGPKNRRYGPLFKERNGFQPLNQEESDVETERLTHDLSPSSKAKA